MQKQIQNVLQRELSRKEFLATIGLGIVSVVGLTTLHRVLSGQSAQHAVRRSGYGSTSYGK